MRLSSKLTIAFAAVAVVPIVAVALVAQELVDARYRGDFARRLDAAEGRIGREYDAEASELRATVERVARPDDPLVGQTLLDLGKGGLDEDQQRLLIRRAPEEMRALGLDVFTLLDERGVVLAAGQSPGRAGARDDAALGRAKGHPTVPLLVEERVATGGGARAALVLEVALPVRTEYARLYVIGGRELGAGFLDRLELPARLLDPDGKPRAASAAGYPSRHFASRRVAIGGGDPQWHVEVAVSDEDLSRALAWIRIAAAALALGGLALAVLLGAVIARRIARPLGELEAAAHRVAAGDLGSAVPVRTRDEVGELARAWNAMVEDLGDARDKLVRAERVAAWREIARRIAHEIKNPLTPIQMAMETLQRVKSSKPQLFDEVFTESSRTILEEVDRLKHIVTEFSSFARLPEPKLQPCAPNDLVESALKLYAGAVPIARELEPALPSVRADPQQMQQVLLNLLENARDAVSQAGGGAITVRTRAAGTRVAIEVADTGAGISDEAKARLFTPYFTTKAHGTGLGLAIVHRIVTDHGGDVQVRGAPGEGATFTVELPTC